MRTKSTQNLLQNLKNFALSKFQTRITKKIAADIVSAPLDFDKFFRFEDEVSATLSKYLSQSPKDKEAAALSELLSANADDFQGKIDAFLSDYPKSEFLPFADFLNLAKVAGLKADFSKLKAFSEKYPKSKYLENARLREFFCELDESTVLKKAEFFAHDF